MASSNEIKEPVNQPYDFFYNEMHLLQLETPVPETQKLTGISVPYAALEQPYWDISEDNTLPSQIPIVPFNKELHEDFNCIGPVHSQAVYDELRPMLIDAFNYRKIEFKNWGDEFRINPLKFAYYISLYASKITGDYTARDDLALVIDKLVLFAFLPVILNEDTLSEALKLETGTPVLDGIEFEENLKKAIKEQSDQLLFHPDFYNSDNYIEVQRADAEEMLTKLGNYKEQDQLFMDIASLDEFMAEKIKELMDRLKAIPEVSNIYDTNISALDTEKIVRRTIKMGWPFRALLGKRVVTKTISKSRYQTHHDFYDFISETVDSLFNGFVLPRFQYSSNQPVPTVVEEVDVRSRQWAEKAFRLSIEGRTTGSLMHNIHGRIEQHKDGDYAELKQAVNSLTAVSGQRFLHLQEKEELKKQLNMEGFVLNLDQVDSEDNSFGLFRKEQRTYTVRVDRVRYEMRRRTRRVKFKIGPFKVSWKTHSWMEKVKVPYHEFETRTKTIQIPLDVDFSPLQSYLEQPVPKETWVTVDDDGNSTESEEEYARTIKANNLNLPDFTDRSKFKNKQKDYRIFNVTNDDLTDQYGASLEEVMKAAENIDERRRLVLILPVAELTSDQELEITSYKAIHNPIPRQRADITPTVGLIETFKQNIAESLDHYRGSLSHTETLLPGERRNLTITSQTKTRIEQTRQEVERVKSTSNSSSEIQIQVRKEVEKKLARSRANSWSVSASASGSWGMAKVGGSASSSSSSSKKQTDISKSLNDNVSRTMNSMSNENEVTITTSSKTEFERGSSTEKLVEIENFNKGRSVTHRFYQVLRKFESQVSLQDINIAVNYSDEVVPGYGYTRTEVYSLSEISQILPEYIEEQRSEYIEALASAIASRLELALGTDIKNLNISDSTRILNTQTWHVNTGSFVIDTEVSDSPALEQYVNDAREAEIAKINAQTEYLSLAAKSLDSGVLALPMSVESLSVNIADSSEG